MMMWGDGLGGTIRGVIYDGGDMTYPINATAGDTVNLTFDDFRVECRIPHHLIIRDQADLIYFFMKNRDKLTGDVLPFLMKVKRHEAVTVEPHDAQ